MGRFSGFSPLRDSVCRAAGDDGEILPLDGLGKRSEVAIRWRGCVSWGFYYPLYRAFRVSAREPDDIDLCNGGSGRFYAYYVHRPAASEDQTDI